MKVVELNSNLQKQRNEQLAAELRYHAELALNGQLTEFCMMSVQDGEYQYCINASPKDALLMATLLHRQTVENLIIK